MYNSYHNFKTFQSINMNSESSQLFHEIKITK